MSSDTVNRSVSDLTTICSIPQNIAFVVAEPWHTTDWTTDLGLLVRAFRAAGHESSVTCTQVVGDPVDYPTFTVTLEQMSDSSYWKARGVTIAVVFNWLLRGASVLVALRNAGAWVMQFGDSDGLEGMRVHPAAQFQRMWHLRKDVRGRANGLFTLVKKYLYSHRKEDALLLRNLETAHFTTLTSRTGREAFLRFLQWAGRSELAERIGVMPSPLAPAFLEHPLVLQRVPLLVAVGRWADPQKDAPLLAATLTVVFQKRSDVQIRIIGSGGDAVFAPLTRKYPQAQYLGRVPHKEMVDHLSAARTLVFSSRWEGVPVVSLEMAALGGTVVGPASLPGIAAYARENGATLAARRTPESLAEAVLDELSAWESGTRNPEAIASLWRARLSPTYLAAQILTRAVTHR